MELSEAMRLKQEIFSAFGLSYVRTRSDEPRVSVGIAAPRQPAGVFRVAIRARSEEELDRARKSGRDPLLSLHEGEVDLRITGPIVALAVPPGEAPHRRLVIGASVGHYLCTAGTLGFFARRIEDGSVGFVSNNHVLAAEDAGEEGDDVLHPAPADDGVRELDIAGYLSGDYPRLDVDDPVVDCAFARLRPGMDFDPSTVGPGVRLNVETVVLEEQREVLKNGRTTGLTRGKITAFAMDHCDVEYESGIVVFNKQIEIESGADGPFSKPGDSGSLIVNPLGHPIGLLAANSFDCRLHYANPIGAVLEKLGVVFLS